MQQLNSLGHWRTYAVADGLASHKVEHIAEDSEGYLWFATWDSGVSRFDGDQFQTFTRANGLCGNQVYALCLDKQDRLWIGTRDGGVCWYRDESFCNTPIADSAPTKVDYIFADREGRVWCSSSEAVGYFENDEFHDLLPHFRQSHPLELSDCWGIEQDKTGRIWFGFNHLLYSENGALYEYQSELFEMRPQHKGSIKSLACDAHGRLWLGENTQLFHLEDNQLIPFDEPLPGTARKISVDREGRVWICTHRGVVCYENNKRSDFINSEQGLAFDITNCAHQDHRGLFWLATWGGGISCYDPHSIQTLTESPGRTPTNNPKLQQGDTNGKIWLALLNDGPHRCASLALYHGQELTFFEDPILSSLGDFHDITEDDKGQLWLSGADIDNLKRPCLLRYSAGHFSTVPMDPPYDNGQLSGLLSQPGGLLYLGHCQHDQSTIRLLRYDGQRYETLWEYSADHLGDAYLKSLISDEQDTVWFAIASRTGIATNKGLVRWHADTGAVIYRTSDGLIDNRIESICFDEQGRIWCATWGGISCFDGEYFTNYTTDDGLPHNHIHCAYADTRGHLWFASEGGVIHSDGQTFQVVRGPQIDSTISIAEDETEKCLLFSTRHYVVRYRPNKTAPRVQLQQTIADQIYKNDETLLTCDSTQQFTFEYRGMSFRTPPSDLLYTYRLLGYDADWQAPTRERRAYYHNLAPGDYSFEVRAIDRDLNYSAPEQRVLHIQPDPRDQRIDELEERVRQRTAELQRTHDELEERARQRTADLDYLISGAHCLLWYANVEDRGTHLQWDDHVINQKKAQEIVPVERAPGQSYGSALKALRHPEDSQRMDHNGETALREGRTFYAHDYRCKGADNQWLHLHEEVHIEILSPGHWRLVGVCTDISERTHLEEQLRQSQKMEALGQLTAGIAHNFNNMLQAIIGNIGIMHYDASDEQRVHLQEVDKASQRAADMVQQLLVFSRKGFQPAYRPLVLEEILGEVVAVCYKTFDRQIEVVLQLRTTGAVLGDGGALSQVFLNLCLNARDALVEAEQKNPRILIEMDRAPIDQQIPVNTGEEYLRVRISDNGIGMDEETRQRIFDPFFTTKAPGSGTGLGLSTAFGTVEQHGGLMQCDSTPEQGSTFSIYLPISTQDMEENNTAPSPDSTQGSERILLIDDEAIVRRTVAQALKINGYDTVEAENGPRGLDLFHSQKDTIDLVILDLSMPGMPGTEVLTRLRDIDPTIRVVILSGYAVDDLGESTPQAIAQKPISIGQFMSTVRNVLDDRQVD